jgi:hypothetical protein
MEHYNLNVDNKAHPYSIEILIFFILVKIKLTQAEMRVRKNKTLP